MTIWLLALLLLGCVAGVGHQQGAIRAAISFVGIVVAALLAGPLARLVRPGLSAVGVANPVLLWALAPFIVFVVVLAAFKIGGLAAHKKVDVFYKYKAGDLRLALFNRINARLGLCLGLLNGLAYLVLISFVIHTFSYWTVQMATSAEDPRSLRILNRLGRDLDSTGMSRVAVAVDPLPSAFYDMADLTGLIYQNPGMEARLSRYPGFISLGLRPEFQDLGQDTTFTELRLKQRPIREVLDHPKAEVIVKNPALLREVWDTLLPDLKDLDAFLRTGKSAKYDSEPILGRWLFDVTGSVNAYRRVKPNVPAVEMVKFRRLLAERFGKTVVVAGPDHQVMLRNLPQLKQQPGQPPSGEVQTLQGKWKGAGGDYEFDLTSGTDHRTAKIEGGRLVVSGEGMALVFGKED
jgi:hypothetical protein